MSEPTPSSTSAFARGWGAWIVFLLVAGVAMLALVRAASAQATCEDGLAAYTDDDGSITLTWSAVPNATAYQVLVAAGGGSLTPLSPQATAGSTTYTYLTPQPAASSYSFAVVALQGGSNPVATFCTVTVASIPFFPAWTASVLALGGGLACVSVLLNRR